MNWLTIIVVLFLGAYMVRGYHNGFIKTVFSVLAVFIALIVASVGSPILGGMLQKQESIYSYIDDKVSATLNIDEKVNKLTDAASYIDGLTLPDSVKELLLQNQSEEAYTSMKVEGLGDYVSGYLTCLILNAIAYSILFIVTLIVVRILANVLDLVSKLPLINSINKIGGLGVGVLHGLIILWVLCIALTIFSGTEIGKVLYEQINGSTILSAVYNHNLLLQGITNVAKSFLFIK